MKATELCWRKLDRLGKGLWRSLKHSYALELYSKLWTSKAQTVNSSSKNEISFPHLNFFFISNNNQNQCRHKANLLTKVQNWNIHEWRTDRYKDLYTQNQYWYWPILELWDQYLSTLLLSSVLLLHCKNRLHSTNTYSHSPLDASGVSICVSYSGNPSEMYETTF